MRPLTPDDIIEAAHIFYSVLRRESCRLLLATVNKKNYKKRYNFNFRQLWRWNAFFSIKSAQLKQFKIFAEKNKNKIGIPSDKSYS